MKNKYHRKLFIGPMTKNVVDSILENKLEKSVGIIPSRRQVDSFPRGYVNNWTTREFLNHTNKKDLVRCRDHAGPLQGKEKDDGFDSLRIDVTEENHFQIIHVDPWKKASSIEEAVDLTSSIISFCYNLNKKVLFEIGTEQGIKPYTPPEFEYFLTEVKKKSGEKFNNVLYAVIQGGTLLQDTHNAGKLDEVKCFEMIKICKKFDLLSKEHNGDYLTKDQIRSRFDLGLDAINIAPEFGNLETNSIMNLIDEKTLEVFFSICYDSNMWKKWLPDDFKISCAEDKKKIIQVSGHYVFSDPNFELIRNRAGVTDKFLNDLHKNRIEEIFKSIGS